MNDEAQRIEAERRWRKLWRILQWTVFFGALAVFVVFLVTDGLSQEVSAAWRIVAVFLAWLKLPTLFWVGLGWLSVLVLLSVLEELRNPHWKGLKLLVWWNDCALVLGSVVAERIPAIIVLIVACAVGRQMVEHTASGANCVKTATFWGLAPASANRFWPCLSNLDFDEGRAALVAATVTVGLALIGYLMRLRARRLHTARAILAEIAVMHEGNLNAVAGTDFNRLRQRVLSVPPIRMITTVVDNGKTPMLDSEGENIALLPRSLVRPIAAFYQSCNMVDTSIKSLDCEAFQAASPIRRGRHVTQLSKYVKGDYMPTANCALRRLGVYNQACRWLPL